MITRTAQAYWHPLLVLLCWSLLSPPAWADIVPDTTLPTPSEVASFGGNEFVIDGGTLSGHNLFHSFESFSIPAEGKALFESSGRSVERIISRVTGDLPSSIDGLIEANSEVDLIFANPNGVLFGPNARLDIGGSFISTTAETVEFEDGLDFSAVDPAADPLLSVQTPVGLQFGESSGAIQVEAAGNGLNIALSPVGMPLDLSSEAEGLQVETGETLALLGEKIQFTGGMVSAPNGQVHLGAVESGTVQLTSTSEGWTVSYDGVFDFGDITLGEEALVNASDATDGIERMAGSIHLQGDSILLDDGSALVVQHQGPGRDESVSIQAAEELILIGALDVPATFTTFTDATGILVEAVGEGDSGTIRIQAPELIINNDGAIFSATYGPGKSAPVEVQVLGAITLAGGAEAGGAILSYSFGPGDAGDIDVAAREIEITSGSAIASQTLGTGDAARITIDAPETIRVSGTTGFGSASVIASSSLGQGAADEMTLRTGRLFLTDGGTISTGIFAEGSSGALTIEATEAVIIDGEAEVSSAQSLVPSQISASALNVPFELLGLPQPELSGSTGRIIITTPTLLLSNGGLISALHEGTCDTCNAGAISITAHDVLLRNESSINAFSTSGLGGDVNLDVRDNLILRRGSEITATAGGTSPEADGGNITASADLLLALPREDSDIEASAEAGTGGNIQITADGLLGFRVSDGETPRSELNASSNLGVDGVVEITDPDADLDEDFLLTDEAPVDPADLVALGCSPAASSFLITGRGGLPANPLQADLSTANLWQDLRPLESGAEPETVSQAEPQEQIRLTGLALDSENQLLVMAEDAAGSALGCRFLKTSQIN